LSGKWFSACLLACVFGGLALPGQIPSAPMPQGVADTSLEDAKRLISEGQFNQAATVLRVLLERDGGSAPAHELLAYSYLRLDEPRESLIEYNSAAKITRPSAVDLQNVAKDYVLLGDDASAEHWMRRAVGMDERDSDGWYGLGRVLYVLQRFQEAADCFQRSLVLAPRSVKAENNLGLSYEGLNRNDDAVAAYRKAIAWQQSDPHPSEQPLLNLGIVLVHAGQLTEAEGLLKQAAEIAPKDPRIREELGHLYLQQSQLPKAQEELEAAIALEPKKPALHFLLGKVYHQEGHEDQAKVEFSLASNLSGYHSTPEKF